MAAALLAVIIGRMLTLVEPWAPPPPMSEAEGGAPLSWLMTTLDVSVDPIGFAPRLSASQSNVPRLIRLRLLRVSTRPPPACGVKFMMFQPSARSVPIVSVVVAPALPTKLKFVRWKVIVAPSGIRFWLVSLPPTLPVPVVAVLLSRVSDEFR